MRRYNVLFSREKKAWQTHEGRIGFCGLAAKNASKLTHSSDMKNARPARQEEEDERFGWQNRAQTR